jgi:hypothetical protein
MPGEFQDDPHVGGHQPVIRSSATCSPSIDES